MCESLSYVEGGDDDDADCDGNDNGAGGGDDGAGGTCCVDMVSRVVTPSETLAGTALGSSQKLTWGSRVV